MAGSAATSAASVILALLMNASLHQLWSFINAEQHMIFMPLFPGLKYPANVALVNSFLMGIVFFDILPTDFLDEQIYYVPEEEPYNTNQQMFDNESTLFTVNASTILWLLFMHVLLIVISALCYCVKCLRNYLSKYLF